jgi:hypothetical protein
MPDRRLNNISVEWISADKAGNKPFDRFRFWRT